MSSHGRSSTAEGPPINGGFMVGERVRYWSSSQRKWIFAHVQRVNFGHGGGIISYDLSAKSQAAASCVRKASCPADAPPPQMPPRPAFKPRPDAAASDGAGAKGSAPPTEEFEVGDQVQYWSDTKARWLDAKVESRMKGMGGALVYDLNCKKGTPAGRLRSKPAEYVVGEKVEYWSAGAGRWVVGKVTKVNLQLGQCDLDVKQGAKLGRMRKLSAGEEIPHYELGSRVQYWSESKGRWLEAVVEGSRKRGGIKLYDLNCKKGTPAHRLRPSPGARPAPFEPGDSVEYWSSSAKRWLLAKVLSLALHLGQCDLDLKKSAALGLVRRPPSGSKPGGGKPGSKRPPEPSAAVAAGPAKQRRISSPERPRKRDT